MSTPSKNKAPRGQIHPRAREGIRLFNAGEYFRAHEALELAWMAAPSPERDLYQGILQIALAYHQILQGNYRGALKMFLRGQRTLAPLGDFLLGVNLRQLREDAGNLEQTLRNLGPGRTAGFSPALFQPLEIAPGMD